jgi:hypothetical protein
VGRVGQSARIDDSIAAVGFAVLTALSIGLAITWRLRPLRSTVCLFLVLAAAICVAGLVLISTVNALSISAMAVFYGVHAILIGGYGVVGLLLK